MIKRNEIFGVLALTLLLGVLFYAAIMQSNWDSDSINQWAEGNFYEVVKIERTMFDHGPFWFVGEDDRIYRVEVKDQKERPRVAYFRFGLFGFDQEWSE